MTDRKNLYEGLSRAAWGYFLLHFDINLGTVSILPAFVGYALLLSALRILSGERRDLALLRPLCMLLGTWNGADWLFSWMGGSVKGLFPPLDMVITVAGLYFHFQFLTDMAALAEIHQPEGGSLDRRLLRRRTVYVLVVTLVNTLHYLPVSGESELRNYAALGMMLVGVLAALFVMTGLFALRRLFRDQPEEPQA